MNLSEEIISKAVKSVIDGKESACEVYALLKNLTVQIASGLKLIKEDTMKEAREFNKGEPYHGGIWSFTSTGDTLNYEDDPMFKDLKKRLSDRQSILKDAFTAKQKGNISVNEDTGEEITIVSIKKVSEETIKFSPK